MLATLSAIFALRQCEKRSDRNRAARLRWHRRPVHFEWLERRFLLGADASVLVPLLIIDTPIGTADAIESMSTMRDVIEPGVTTTAEHSTTLSAPADGGRPSDEQPAESTTSARHEGDDPIIVQYPDVAGVGGEVPDLPGLHWLGKSASSLAGQVLYLDFDGATRADYSGPVVVHGIDVPPFRPTPPELAARATEVIAVVVDRVEQMFDGSGVLFTLTRPAGGSPYSSIYIGGYDNLVNEIDADQGLAEAVDIYNQNRSDSAFIFSDALAWTNGSLESYAHELTLVIAHEIGHILGYGHDHGHERDTAAPEAASYYSSYGTSRTWNITTTAGSHYFEVDGIASYMKTKWYINDVFREADDAGFFAVDPDYSYSFGSGLTTVKAYVYYSDAVSLKETHTWNVTVDTTAPTTPGTPDMGATSDRGNPVGQSDSDNITNDSRPTFSWSGSTDSGGAGLAGYEYRLGATGAWNSTGNGTTASFALPSQSDGGYTLYIRAKDGANNYSAASAGLGFTIDTVGAGAPTGLTNPADPTADTRPNVTWSAAGGSVWRYEIAWDDSDLDIIADYTFYSTDTRLDDNEFTTDLGLGEWEWYVRAIDPAGNEGSWAPGFFDGKAITIADLTAPTTPGTPDMDAASDRGNPAGQSDSDNLTSDSRPAFSWSGSTDSGGAGLAGYEYRLGATGTWNSTGNGTTASFTLPSQSDGVYTLYIRAKDGANNYSGASGGLGFTIDTVGAGAPTGLTNPADVTADTRPNVTWSAASGGVWRYEIAWDDSDLDIIADYTFYSTDTRLDDNEFMTDLGLGEWEWYVRAIDPAGNEGSWAPGFFDGKAITIAGPEITAIRWEDAAGNELTDAASRKANSTVYIEINTRGVRGTDATVYLYEDDGLFGQDDFIRVITIPIPSDGDIGRLPWIVEWHEDEDFLSDFNPLQDPAPEYRLWNTTSALGSLTGVSSRTLRVTQPSARWENASGTELTGTVIEGTPVYLAVTGVEYSPTAELTASVWEDDLEFILNPNDMVRQHILLGHVSGDKWRAEWIPIWTDDNFLDGLLDVTWDKPEYFFELEAFGSKSSDITVDLTAEESIRIHEHDPAAGPGIPLVLVHGDHSDYEPSSLYRWNVFSDYISHHPDEFREFDVYVWKHPTGLPIGFNGADESQAARLADYVYDTLGVGQPGRPYANSQVLFLAHSQGGLVVRSFMNHYNSERGHNQGDDVLGLVTLGTPHHGSPFAVPDWDAFGWRQSVGDRVLPFSILVGPGRPAFDSGRPGSVNLAWDNFDGAIVGTQSVDLLLDMIPIEFDLTTRDINNVSTAADDTSFYPEELKSDYGTLASLNSNESYRSKLAVFATYDDSLVDNQPPALLGDLIGQILAYLLWNEHDQLSAVTSLMASYNTDSAHRAGIANDAAYFANDGLVPIQSALFLRSGGGPRVVTRSGNAVSLDIVAIDSRADEVKSYHIYSGGTIVHNGQVSANTSGYAVRDHLDLLATPTVNVGYWDAVAMELTGFVNHAPVANADGYVVPMDTQVTVAATQGVLTNDTDADSDTLSAIRFGDPAHGALSLNADGSFLYNPVSGFVGTDSFSYKASDGSLQSGATTVTLTVSSVNHAPVANPDSYASLMNTVLTVGAAQGVLANDTDSDSNALTTMRLSDPAHGALTLNADGSLLYDPVSGFVGSDSFTYRASDGNLQSASTTATITVSVAHPPALDPIGNKAVLDEALLSFQATATDPDPGTTLSFSLQDDPNDGLGFPTGAVINASTGMFGWTPTATQGPGAYGVKVIVTDGALQDSETISIEVTDGSGVAAAFFHDVRIGNIVDGDGDTYAGQFEIQFDVDIAGPDTQYIVRAYEVDAGGEALVGTSEPFLASGNAVDYHGVTIAAGIHVDEDEDGDIDPTRNGVQSHAEFRLELRDFTTNQVIDTWAPGDPRPLAPKGGAVTLNPGDILVANINGESVIRVDPLTGIQTSVSSGGYLTDPFGVTLDANGDILVADPNALGVNVVGGGAVIRINPATGAQTIVSSGDSFSHPGDLAIAANGEFVVVDLGVGQQPQHKLVRVDPVTGAQTILSSDSSLTLFEGIAIATSGDIFVAGSDPSGAGIAGAVVRIDPVTGAQTLVSLGGNLRGPQKIAIAANGDLWVSTGQFPGAVIRVDPVTGAQTVVSSGGNLHDPRGLAFAENGDLLVADALANKVIRVDPVTGAQTVVSSGGSLVGASGIAVVSAIAPLAAVLVEPAAADVTSALADLAITPVTLDRSGTWVGGYIDVDFSVTNEGDVATPATIVQARLSPGEVSLRNFPVPALAPGQNSGAIAARLELPPTLVPGTYSIVLRADPLDRIQEQTENNNTRLSETTFSVSHPDPGGAFDATTAIATSSLSTAVAVGDLNRDGYLDFAVADFGGTVSVVLATGNGQFGTPTSFPAGSQPRAVAIADVNLDGKPDLIVGNDGTSAVSVLLGDGSGAFAPRTTYTAVPKPQDIAVADFNRDGIADLAVPGHSANAVAILLGDGVGGFSAPTTVPVGQNPRFVAVGDLNADGKVDAVVANPSSNTVSVLLGDGSGNFPSRTDFAVAVNPVGVAIGDLNGDGRPDLAVASQQVAAFTVLFGDGNGAFAGRADVPALESLRHVVVADFTGDGRVDVAVTNATQSLSIFPGRGDGTFDTHRDYVTGQDPAKFAVADFNRDHRLDIVIAKQAAPSVAVLFNTEPSVNDPPAANPDSYTTTEDTSLAVEPPGVLANDTDADGDALTMLYVAGPYYGSLNPNSNGGFIYTPTPNYHGPDSFTYRVRDDYRLESDIATVTIDVTSVNDPPVAHPDSYATTEDATLAVEPPGVLTNDTDADGDALTMLYVAGPQHGSLNPNSNGGFTYIPAADYHGTDSFTYRAGDAHGLESDDTTVSITVTPVNDAPVANPDSYTTPQDTTLAVDPAGVLANDTDVDGDSLTMLYVAGPQHGSLNPNSNGGFTYIPAADYHGADSFTYRASDGQALSDAATVTLSVEPAGTLRVTNFEQSASGFRVEFSHAIDPGVLNLYDTQAGDRGPADITLVGAVRGAVRGTLVLDDGARGVVFIATGGVLQPDTYTATVRSATNGVKAVADGRLLDGNADGTSGDSYVTQFTVGPLPAVVVSIGDFARGPGQSVHVPAGGIGLPIRITSTGGIESVDLTLDYDPALLTVSTVAPGSALPGDAIVLPNFVSPGRLMLGITLPTPLPGGTFDLITLTVAVPGTATYRAKHVLDLVDVSVNEGATPAVGDDGVHVVAYLGDATGNGAYSVLDGQAVLRVAVRLDSGFANFPLVDPVILADITGNGAISSLDATRILQEASGRDRAEVPPLPVPIPALTFAGADPAVTMSPPTSAAPGEMVTVPVNVVDTAAGIERVDLEIHYDPGVLEVDPGTGVRAGTLTTDGSLAYQVNAATGTITAALTMSGPLAGGRGSLMEIDYRVRPDAAAGATRLDLVRVNLNEDALAVGPAVPQRGPDPTDSEIRIADARRLAARVVSSSEALLVSAAARAQAPSSTVASGRIDWSAPAGPLRSLFGAAQASIPAPLAFAVERSRLSDDEELVPILVEW